MVDVASDRGQEPNPSFISLWALEVYDVQYPSQYNIYKHLKIKKSKYHHEPLGFLK